MDNIPKTIHFIWIGSSVPDTSAENIVDWRNKNPDYTVKLWYDSMHMLAGKLRRKIAKEVDRETKEAVSGLRLEDRGPAERKIKPILSGTQTALSAARVQGGGDNARIAYLAEMTGKDPGHYQQKKVEINWDLAVLRGKRITLVDARTVMPSSKLGAVYEKEMVERNTNFGAASDLLRYEILKREGGIYADVDIACLRPFGQLQVGHNLALWGRYGVTRSVSNGIIACCAGSRMIRSAIHLVLAKYSKIGTEAELKDLYANNMRSATVHLTGPTIGSQVIDRAFAKREDHVRLTTPFFSYETAPEAAAWDHQKLRELDGFKDDECSFPDGYIDFEARPEARVHKWLVADANAAVRAAAGV